MEEAEGIQPPSVLPVTRVQIGNISTLSRFHKIKRTPTGLIHIALSSVTDTSVSQQISDLQFVTITSPKFVGVLKLELSRGIEPLKCRVATDRLKPFSQLSIKIGGRFLLWLSYQPTRCNGKI